MDVSVEMHVVPAKADRTAMVSRHCSPPQRLRSEGYAHRSLSFLNRPDRVKPPWGRHFTPLRFVTWRPPGGLATSTRFARVR